jgi:hypothetical protein
VADTKGKEWTTYSMRSAVQTVKDKKMCFLRRYTCAQAMLWFFLINLKGCNVGITDGRDL